MSLQLLHSAAVLALGGALLHFIWEAAAIGLLAVALQTVLRRASAQTRYLTQCFALFSLPLLFAGTFSAVRSGWLQPLPKMAVLPVVAGFLPYVVLAWVAGAAGLGCYTVGGWMLLRRARLGLDLQVPPSWHAAMARLAVKLKITGTVRLALSTEIPGPCTLGWLRPLILLPVAALTAMPPAQVEAVLAHELAHIRRHDYLVNLLQRAVEVLFFFHPAVWWMSRQVSIEREHCCDDLAIAAGGNRFAYARALVDLEEWRSQLAVAAAGGSLRQRVERILQTGMGSGRPVVRAALAGAGMVLMLAVGAAVVVPKQRPTRPQPLAFVLPAVLPAAAVRTSPPGIVRPRYVRARYAVAPVAQRLAEATTSPAAAAAPAAAPTQMGAEKMIYVVSRQAVGFEGGDGGVQPAKVVMAFRLTGEQTCAPRLEIVQPVVAPATPMGFELIGLGTVMHCEPVLAPVAMWFIST